MASAKHEDFRTGGVISLWLGNFAEEDALDDYLEEQFEKDFGFEIYPPDGPEGDVSEEGPKPIHELLGGFSCCESFVDAATVEANSRGWTDASSAVVFYNFRYDSRFVNPAASGLLVFIGVVPYGGFGQRPVGT